MFDRFRYNAWKEMSVSLTVLHKVLIGNEPVTRRPPTLTKCGFVDGTSKLQTAFALLALQSFSNSYATGYTVYHSQNSLHITKMQTDRDN